MPQVKVAILGSTGSIGVNTLKVIERFPDRFKVVALTAFNNVKLLARQIKKFKPTHAAASPEGCRYLEKNGFARGLKVCDAKSGMPAIAALRMVDVVVLAVRGSAALAPFLEAVRAGKRVAPANKEALVMAGHIIMPQAKKYRAPIIPIDSEQSAIFQCLDGKDRRELKKIYLTASGGPLCSIDKKKFGRLSVAQVLNHPRWKMGKKITVDSATLMNKGFEVMEAKWLFGLNVNQIEVLVHPQAVIHSMVEFCDGSILAQLGITDMRLPIQYALTYPKRLDTGLARTDFAKLKELTFKKPDFEKFPALSLCFYAAKKGGTLPCVLNAANEEAVEAFLGGRLSFPRIYEVAEKVALKHRIITAPHLNAVWQADAWAREEAKRIILN